MRKKKLPTLPKLKKDLWTVFSRYIRLRDKGICISCLKQCEYGSAYHAGHLLPKANCGLALYFDEGNVNGQCYNCNMNLGGAGAMYAKHLIEKYGQDELDRIYELFKNKDNPTTIWKRHDYDEKIEYYKQKVKELE